MFAFPIPVWNTSRAVPLTNLIVLYEEVEEVKDKDKKGEVKDEDKKQIIGQSRSRSSLCRKSIYRLPCTQSCRKSIYCLYAPNLQQQLLKNMLQKSIWGKTMTILNVYKSNT